MKSHIHYTDDYNKLVKQIDPNLKVSEYRLSGLVLPLRNSDGDLFGCQLRVLTEGDFRYKTIMFDENQQKSYGWEFLENGRKINVFEGAFDSMFVKNSVASLDSSLHSGLEKTKIPLQQFHLWYDAEPYNKQLMKQKLNSINLGYSVAFYCTEFYKNSKDLNGLIQKLGMDRAREVIKKTQFYKGNKAKFQLKMESLGRFL